jgi:hypothetical protein
VTQDPRQLADSPQDGRTAPAEGEEAGAIQRARQMLAAGVPTALRALEEVGADPGAHPVIRRTADRARRTARRRGAG